MYTVNLLTSLVENHQVLAYLLIFVGLIFEGEFFVIFTGILAHIGALNFYFSLLFIILGAITKTFIGYALGEYLFKKFNHKNFFKYIQKRVYIFFPRFKTKPFWSIFISKFIIGANNLVIIFCGYEKINYKQFLKAEIFATIVWAPLLLSLGYFFGYTALHISHEIWKFSTVVIVLFILFVFFDKLFTWFYNLFEEFSNNKQS